MKILLASLLLFATGLTSLHASTPIKPAELPAPVVQTLEEYFPGAKTLSAERETDDRRTHYEVRLQYKAIKLEVELSPEGRILDVEMED
ncbi:MAG: hypothetical protein RLZZ129_956 [Verrucomicrobiota bacterium]|jgi:uncharacterized membrane protein YkoI